MWPVLASNSTYVYIQQQFFYLFNFCCEGQRRGRGTTRYVWIINTLSFTQAHTHALGGGNTPHSVSIAPPPGGLHGLWWKTNNKHKSTNVETWNVRSRANHIRTEKLALVARGTQFRSFVDKTRANVNGMCRLSALSNPSQSSGTLAGVIQR